MIAGEGRWFLDLHLTRDQWGLASTTSFTHRTRANKRLSQPRAAAYRRTTTSVGSCTIILKQGDINMRWCAWCQKRCLPGKRLWVQINHAHKTKSTITHMIVLTIVAIVIIQLRGTYYSQVTSCSWRSQCCQRRTLTTTRQSLNISNSQSGKQCLQTFEFSPLSVSQGLILHSRRRWLLLSRRVSRWTT